MKIKKVRVSGYRALRDVSVDFDALTAFVGRNSAGKSAVLGALSLFYDLSAQLSDFDYFDCDPSGEIRISVTFFDLLPTEEKFFGSYVRDGELTVTKVITKGGVRYLGSKPQIREFAEIRSKPFREQQAAIRALRELDSFSDFSGSTGSQAAIDEALSSYESSHPEKCELIESEGQFLGPTNVGGGSLDNFTKFVFVPAVRDASSELGRKGAIYRLLEVLLLRTIAEREDVKQLNEEFERRAAEIYSKDNLGQLSEISQSINSSLQKYAPGTEVDLDFAELKAPKLPAPEAIALVSEDSFQCPVSHVGHGVQRAIILSVLEQLAHLDRDRSGGVEEESVPNPDLILAIEEPELYLHPLRCRFLAKTLAGLTSEVAKARTQVVYTTHSPLFVGIDRFDRIRLVSKMPCEDTDTKQTSVRWSSTQEVVDSIAAAQDDGEGANFDVSGFSARSETTMTVPVNEGFFADAVLLVEGYSDAAALETIAECLGLAWDEKGLAVIPVQGKGNIDKVFAVFSKLEVSVSVCFDADAHGPQSEQKNNARKNRCLLRLSGNEVQDFPGSGVWGNCAVFAEELERELRSVDENFYEETRSRIATELAVTSVKGLLKKPAAMRRYIKAAYDSGKLPQWLVDFVGQVR